MEADAAKLIGAGLAAIAMGGAGIGIGLLLDAPGYERWAALLNTGRELFGAADWWPALAREARDDARTPLWTAIAEVPRDRFRAPTSA